MPYKVNEISKGEYKFWEVQKKVGDKWEHFGPSDTKEYAQHLCEKANANEKKPKAK